MNELEAWLIVAGVLLAAWAIELVLEAWRKD